MSKTSVYHGEKVLLRRDNFFAKGDNFKRPSTKYIIRRQCDVKTDGEYRQTGRAMLKTLSRGDEVSLNFARV